MSKIISVKDRPYVLNITLGSISRWEEVTNAPVGFFELAAEEGSLKRELMKLNVLMRFAYEAAEPANTEFKKCTFGEFKQEFQTIDDYRRLNDAVGEAISKFFPKAETNAETEETGEDSKN